MAILLVPTDSTGAPSYVQTSTFEGTQYVLQFDYNQRCASWYLSVADTLGVDIYNGVKLVCNFPLLSKCKDPRRPPGSLFVFSATVDLSPASQWDLLPGGRCSLVYATSDWMALVAPNPPNTQAAAAAIAQLQAQVAAGTQTTSTSQYGQQ